MTNQVINVTCAIIIHNSKILVAQRGKQMSLPLQWEFPGGKIEDNESEAACLSREIKEELSIDIKSRDG
jgi:8-oxo-dGTP diphosphatase